MRDFRDLFKLKLGFGLMRLPVQAGWRRSIDTGELNKMIDSFLSGGGRYFDTAYIYHGGQSERAVKDCLVDRCPRQSFMLADKMPVWEVSSPHDLDRIFAEQLSRCGVDYFDSYLLHNLDAASYEQMLQHGGFDFLRHLKQTGQAKYIGFSFHHTPQTLDRILSEQDALDFVQLQINYYDWSSPAIQSRGVYEIAVKHNMPVVVMEPVKGGGLVNIPDEAKAVLCSIDPDSSVASHALRFAASLDHVAVVLSGMSSIEQMQDNLSTLGSFEPMSASELELLDHAVEIIRQADAIACTACRYCEPACPQNIPIPDIFSVYNFMKQFGSANFPAMHYMKVTENRGQASDCIDCGACEQHCPQHLDIRDLLKICGESLEGRWG